MKPEENNIMEFPKSQRDQLEASMSADCWHERVAFGTTKLKYINTFDLYDTANKIFGHGGWQRIDTDYKLIQEDQGGEDCIVAYIAKVTIKVWNGQEWIIRTGVGGGNAKDKSLAKAHENALKEAETDATKRAFFALGYPLGLALYEKSQTHVEGTTGAKPVAQKPQAKFMPTGEKVEGPDFQRLKENVVSNCDMWDLATVSDPGTGFTQFMAPYSLGPEIFKQNMTQINQKTGEDRYKWINKVNEKVLAALVALGEPGIDSNEITEEHPITDDDLPPF